MKRGHTYLAAIVVLTIGYVVLHQVRFWQAFPDRSFERIPAPALYWIPLLILLYLWCRSDAKERRIDLPIATSILVPLFFPIGIPYYFFHTYDTRRALLRIASAAIFSIGCIIAAMLASRLTENYMLTGHLTTRWSGP